MSEGTTPQHGEATAALDDPSGLLLYEPYYGLSEKPFSLSSTMRSGATRYLVLVGPYPSRAAAAGGLEAVARISGVARPVLQTVPPATSVAR